MPSPTTSGHALVHESPFNGKSPSKGKLMQPALLLNGKGKSPAKAPLDEEALENKAIIFAQRSTLVRSCFHCWHQRIVERAAWIEACQQSDTYRQKIKNQRQSPAHLDKKRRISAGPGTVVQSPPKKRARRRVSSDFHPPRTDEELAQRFKENHEEHERRWAQGSFLKVITNYVKTKSSGAVPHHSWCIWLSMNPDSDATAIWLERKFDVPTSGDWVSEAVFSIPLARTKDPNNSDSPGLIVFECTPLEGVTDELERKYRILDDCARLRDLVNAFPSKRHFIPSLLIISWIEEEDQAKSMTDFADMTKKLVESRSIDSSYMLSITAATKDLDRKLGEALNTLDLDLEGKLVRSLSIRGTFKLFEPPFTSFMTEWIENCSANGHFDWHIFGQVVQVAVALMNETVRSVSILISDEPHNVFPAFGNGDVMDNNSAYERIIAWLSAMGGSAENIALNLQSHRDIGQDFPAREFFEHLWDLAQSRTEIWLKHDSRTKFFIPISDIISTLEAHKASYEPHKARLGKALHMSFRRSPKRRSTSVDTELSSSQSKRRRLSSPVESQLGEEPTPLTSPYLNGHLTPSPTPTTMSLAPSDGSAVVTVAMLRALTRDMKKKYVGSA